MDDSEHIRNLINSPPSQVLNENDNYGNIDEENNESNTLRAVRKNNKKQKTVQEQFEMPDEAFIKAGRSDAVRKNGDGGENNNNKAKAQFEVVADADSALVQRYFLDYLKSPNCFEKYKEQVLALKENELATIWVDFSEIMEFKTELGQAIVQEYYRFKPCLERAVQLFVRDVSPDYVMIERGQLDREFFISFTGVPPGVCRVRDMRCDHIGRLITVSGTITRSSEVRPELYHGAFQCGSCSTKIFKIDQQFRFTKPVCCTSCEEHVAFALLPEESQFNDWQKLRVQENAAEVPAGSMPRSIEIIVRHECVEKAKPGDQCLFTGSLIVVPDVSKLRTRGDGPKIQSEGIDTRRGRGENANSGVSGLKDLGVRELTYRLAFLACTVQPLQNATSPALAQLDDPTKSISETRDLIRASFTEEETEEIERMANASDLLKKMTNSVAPTIYGHNDIKLGVLLLLFGGVHKKTTEGINLRGDINICIVGDPSTAKSQFLKYVCSFAPRAVYTSGKASTAAGLTASVMKDPDNGEFCIEAGALMLADNGVCCIDEFDKMDDQDQVAIHEAMEQQTISITKAGIQATLNARTSILAAANPINGRYDRSKTLKANLTVGPAIMSRFDLFFVVLDECDEANDRAIAEHIVDIHHKRLASIKVPGEEEEEGDDGDQPDIPMDADVDEGEQVNENERFSAAQLRRYVRFARTIDPIIPPNTQPLFVECYKRLRNGDSIGQSRQAYRITVRQLEALVRLSEALARLHLDVEVKPEYVKKAYQLLRTSIVQVHTEQISFEEMERQAFENLELERDVQAEVARNEQVQKEQAVVAASKSVLPRKDYDLYKQMICVYISDIENSQRDAEGVLPAEWPGVLQNDIVQHVMDRMPNISTEEDIVVNRRLVNQIIGRLIQESVLLKAGAAEEEENDEIPEIERNFLMTHPNYIPS